MWATAVRAIYSRGRTPEANKQLRSIAWSEQQSWMTVIQKPTCEQCCPESQITLSIGFRSCCLGSLNRMESSDPATTGDVLSANAC